MTEQPTDPTTTAVPSRKKKPKWLLIAGGVVVLVLIIAVASKGRGSSTSPQAVTSPTDTSMASIEASGAVASSTETRAPTSTTAAAAAATTKSTPSATPTSTYQPIPAEHYEGTGDDVVTLSKAAGPALLTFSCPDCQHNVVVETKADLLVNEIGAYSGTHLIDTSTRSGPTSTVEITADGSWTLDIADITTASDATSGAGDSVVWVKSGNKVAITHDGEHNFVVTAVGARSGDLLVNEIGPYTGTKAIDTPAIVDITADGNWTITPS